MGICALLASPALAASPAPRLTIEVARAEELLPHVKALLSPRGTATYDARTNVLIVRDVE